MTHIYQLQDAYLTQDSFVTIGVFDGVHAGHQTLIKQFVAEAKLKNCLAVALTFFPHPDAVIQNVSERYYLTSPDERAMLLQSLGVDVVITHPFNETVRQRRATDFADDLCQHLKMVNLWVGSDFALGYKREGTIAFLTQIGLIKGFTVTTMDLVSTDETPISSSRIRQSLLEGDVETVRTLLARPYSVTGRIVHGFQRGRTIGFPTANIDVWGEKMIPRYGVYSGWASLGGEGGERLMAVTNIGVRPTFDGEGVTVEAHLLDFDRDIYGEEMSLTLEKFLRPEMKFSGIDALKAQLTEDKATSRQYLTHIKS